MRYPRRHNRSTTHRTRPRNPWSRCTVCNQRCRRSHGTGIGPQRTQRVTWMSIPVPVPVHGNWDFGQHVLLLLLLSLPPPLPFLLLAEIVRCNKRVCGCGWALYCRIIHQPTTSNERNTDTWHENVFNGYKIYVIWSWAWLWCAMMKVERKCGRQQHQPGTPVKRSGCGGGQRQYEQREMPQKPGMRMNCLLASRNIIIIINIISGNGRPGKSQTEHQDCWQALSVRQISIRSIGRKGGGWRTPLW